MIREPSTNIFLVSLALFDLTFVFESRSEPSATKLGLEYFWKNPCGFNIYTTLILALDGKHFWKQNQKKIKNKQKNRINKSDVHQFICHCSIHNKFTQAHDDKHLWYINN